MSAPTLNLKQNINYEQYKKLVIEDYKTVVLSRECSIIGRREVFLGKGKFGIFGDGKELPQMALNHFFKNGDFRSGYYRDQTLLMAQGLLTPENFFAALYAHTDLDFEPMSGGRQMGAHFLTKSINKDGSWNNLMDQKNHSADVSPTGSQMPRLVGLAQASKIYRKLKIKKSKTFSNNGNEVAWGTIGNASTSEGLFFEAINAAGVLQIPLVMSIWDDEYGISVSNKQQTTKSNISEALSGFEKTSKKNGFEIIQVKGWDYPSLIKAYSRAEKFARVNHIPVIVHVLDLTQPLGHSSSGSHERYKSNSRLEWEKEYDCNLKFRNWILENKISNKATLDKIDAEAVLSAKSAKINAWKSYQNPIKKELKNINSHLESMYKASSKSVAIQIAKSKLARLENVGYREILSVGRSLLPSISKFNHPSKLKFIEYLKNISQALQPKFSSQLYSKEIKLEQVPVKYSKEPILVDGRVILRDNFDVLLSTNDRLLIFGEDCGKIGGVNQGLEGMQSKHGKLRVADTGIREATIVGQGIGMALRGLRPIAEIQYLDYILYCIQILSDDLASLSYRTNGQQVAPLIIRTRGHRLEGIWHSGSPMGGMINLLRGIFILTPRNMTIAAGMYNSLLKLNQPAIVIETLNAYRLKENLPTNIGLFTSTIGEIEVLKEGKDITIISYGATLQLVIEASNQLEKFNIKPEVIDIQTLIPFDLSCQIKTSITKTNKLLIVDEDMPGGGTAYILQQLLDNQNIYNLLDSEPKLLSAKDHRPAYGTDGDYFSKPNVNDIFEAVYQLMNEINPKEYPNLF
ncbi:MAG: thiamine pyrophosphate-dependent enzyme [Flavobacteriaceae bacterium]|nr:thiamine pyrophosphate-dependent enzyme [Flavobacteriaceae bacterium]